MMIKQRVSERELHPGEDYCLICGHWKTLDNFVNRLGKKTKLCAKCREKDVMAHRRRSDKKRSIGQD